MVLHQRQPYSVLVAVLFVPYETCDDGNPASKSDSAKSSFAHAATTLAKRAGRGKRPIVGAEAGAYVDIGADDPRTELFERVFIGLYEQSGHDRGTVHFFDVEQPPPRNGRPSDEQTLSFDGLVAVIEAEVARRNRTAPTWADIPSEDADAG